MLSIFFTPLDQTCGKIFTSPSGVIRYPQQGGRYGNNERCVWLISQSEYDRIAFKQDSLSLQSSRCKSFTKIFLFGPHYLRVKVSQVRQSDA